MATLVLTGVTTLTGTGWTGTAPGPGNPSVSGTISSTTDWSNHIKQVTLDLKAKMEDLTSFGDGAFVVQKPGLKNADLSIDFFQDFSSSVDTTFGAGFLAGTLYYLDIKPTSSSRSATNPSFVVAAYVSSYPAIAQPVGGVAMVNVSFAVTGTYARLTS